MFVHSHVSLIYLSEACRFGQNITQSFSLAGVNPLGVQRSDEQNRNAFTGWFRQITLHQASFYLVTHQA